MFVHSFFISFLLHIFIAFLFSFSLRFDHIVRREFWEIVNFHNDGANPLIFAAALRPCMIHGWMMMDECVEMWMELFAIQWTHGNWLTSSEKSPKCLTSSTSVRSWISSRDTTFWVFDSRTRPSTRGAKTMRAFLSLSGNSTNERSATSDGKISSAFGPSTLSVPSPKFRRCEFDENGNLVCNFAKSGGDEHSPRPIHFPACPCLQWYSFRRLVPNLVQLCHLPTPPVAWHGSQFVWLSSIRFSFSSQFLLQKWNKAKKAQVNVKTEFYVVAFAEFEVKIAQM